MFADVALAARIDRAEARMCADLAASIAGSRALTMDIDGGLAVYAGPSSPMNKIIGLGFDGPIDLARLSAIEAAWRDRREPVRVELSILADSTVAPALTDRGYRLHGFENVLGRSLDRLEPPSNSAIDIERVSDADRQTFVAVAVAAFLELDGTGRVAEESLERAQLEGVLSDMVLARGFVGYLARIDGQAVGQGALHIDGSLAQLAGAGTLPAFRGRGVQKVLLQRRLQDARGAGCDLAVVTTSPGTRSQENVMRRGFTLLYTRAILIRP